MHSVFWSLSNQSSCEKSKTCYEDKIDVLSVKPQVSWKHDYCVIYISGGGKIKNNILLPLSMSCYPQPDTLTEVSQTLSFKLYGFPCSGN